MALSWAASQEKIVRYGATTLRLLTTQVNTGLVTNALLEGHKILFSCGPGYATVSPSTDSSDCVHGIVITLSNEELERLVHSEPFYDTKTVKVRVYGEASLVSAYCFISKTAFTAEKVSKPSERYLNLLIYTAKESGLDGEYISLLEQHDFIPYTPQSMWEQLKQPVDRKVWSEHDVRQAQARGEVVWAMCGFVVRPEPQNLRDDTRDGLLEMLKNREVDHTEFLVRAVRNPDLPYSLGEWPDGVTDAHLLWIQHNQRRVIDDVFIETVGLYSCKLHDMI